MLSNTVSFEAVFPNPMATLFELLNKVTVGEFKTQGPVIEPRFTLLVNGPTVKVLPFNTNVGVIATEKGPDTVV